MSELIPRLLSHQKDLNLSTYKNLACVSKTVHKDLCSSGFIRWRKMMSTSNTTLHQLGSPKPIIEGECTIRPIVYDIEDCEFYVIRKTSVNIGKFTSTRKVHFNHHIKGERYSQRGLPHDICPESVTVYASETLLWLAIETKWVDMKPWTKPISYGVPPFTTELMHVL